MESSEDKVESFFKESKVCSFLADLIELCNKHNVYIDTFSKETIIKFQNWDCFSDLEVDGESASLYWSRIQTDVVIRRPKGKKLLTADWK